MYYVLAKRPDPYPPAFGGYLNKLAPTIGGEVNWTESSDKVYSNFAKTGKDIILDPLKGVFFPYISYKFYKVIGCEIRDPIWRQ